MIVCPNCSHQNPDGAIQCEACYTPLPSMTNCPSCGALVQSDASFCGQCGANLSNAVASAPAPVPSNPTPSNQPAPDEVSVSTSADVALGSTPSSPDLAAMKGPDLAELDPLVEPEPLVASVPSLTMPDRPEADIPLPDSDLPHPDRPESALAASLAQPSPAPSSTSSPVPSSPPAISAPVPHQATQIQTQSVRLLHTQTNTLLELPTNLSVIHIGKPNDRVPPDIDISGFKDSEVVSRMHADIRVEGDSYYIEDVGSSNGTYINNVPLPPGNRHRLRVGDRIALGKGDKVSFLVQMS